MKWYVKVWQNYIVFEGRARRIEFWMFFFIHLAITIGLAYLGSWDSTNISMIVLLLYQSATLMPTISVVARYQRKRVVDINRDASPGRIGCSSIPIDSQELQER